MFALYGVGTKLVSIGETHCEVEVIFKDLKVFRRTKPNRLVVKDLISQQEYSDDAGETIIEERFGLSFETICYLQQNFAKSFIMMSPADKLEFIEKTIFKTVNIENIKKKCSELIARKNNDLVSATSQFEFCNQHLLKLVEPNKVSFPIKTKDIEKTIKNQNTKFNNCKIIIKRNEARIEVIKDELSRFRIMEAKVGSKKENLIKLKFDLKKYNEFKTSLNYTNEDDVCLEDFKNKLMVLTANKELLFLKEKLKLDKERFEIMKKEEIDSRNNEIEEWKQSLWKECKKDEIEPQIETEKQFIKDYDELVRLESSLTNVNETLLKENKIKLQESRKEYERKKELQATLELQKKIYTCPCCSAALQFNNNSLKTYEKDIVKIDVNEKKLRKEIDDLSTLISILEIDIPKTENNLENNKSYLKQIQRIKKIYNNEIGDRKEAEALLGEPLYFHGPHLQMPARLREPPPRAGEGRLLAQGRAYLRGAAGLPLRQREAVLCGLPQAHLRLPRELCHRPRPLQGPRSTRRRRACPPPHPAAPHRRRAASRSARRSAPRGSGGSRRAPCLMRPTCDRR